MVDPDGYDWEEDAPLRRLFVTTMFYEMQVAGFTPHPTSGCGEAPDEAGARADRVVERLRSIDGDALPFFE